MPLRSGTRLGVYEVLAPLGAGGMGEVYRARDAKLGRDVALKILPEFFASDPDRLMRFEREAKTLATLNHPNIAQIYGLEESVSTRALVMELVEGEDLSEVIARGALPIEHALPIGRQIAQALEAAHDADIVHRDLKPANVKLRPDGTVKVLDFGLAKGGGPTGMSSHDLAASPTFTSPALTQMGVIIGTAAYMAPEQARGKRVGRTADVWAFGCVLFEMLTGRRAFPGEDVTDTLAAIVRGEPEWAALPAGTPTAVRRLLRRTLEKDPAKRLDSMRAVRLELDDPGDEPASAAVAPPTKKRRTLVVAVLAVASLALLGAAAAWRFGPAEPSTVTHFSITPPPDTRLEFETNHVDLALLPNGRGLVYWNRIGSDNRLVLRPFDRFEETPLPNFPETGRGAFVSADSQWVGFQMGNPGGSDAALTKLSIAGGPPVRVATIDGNLRGGSWGSTGTILFATQSVRTGLQRVSAAGGEVHVVTRPEPQNGEIDHRWPQLLPGDTHAVFTIVRRDRTSDIALVDLASASWRVLVRNGTFPRYADGVLMYADAAGARWVRFDPARLEIAGEPASVPLPVVTKDSGAANFDVVPGGTFAFRPGSGFSAALELVWMNAAGSVTPVPLEPKAYRGIRLSPDGRKAALSVDVDQEVSLWIADLERHTLSRVTPSGFSVGWAAWRPDGGAIVASLNHLDEREHPHGLFLMSPSGTTPLQRLTQAPPEGRHATPSWSPDGTAVLFSEFAAGREGSAIMRVAPGGKPERILAAPTPQLNAALSSDGRWLAYTGLDTGRAEVYVRPSPDVDADRIVVSTGGGSLPQWSADGRELLYTDREGNLVAVPVIRGPKLSFGPPAIRITPRGATPNFAVAPDGRRVLTTRRPARQASSPNEYRVVLGFLDQLKRSISK